MPELTNEQRDLILLSINQNVKDIQADNNNMKIAINALQDTSNAMQNTINAIQNTINAMQNTISGILSRIEKIEKELAKKPDEDRVREIVREEVNDAFTRDTFKLIRTPGKQ